MLRNCYFYLSTSTHTHTHTFLCYSYRQAPIHQRYHQVLCSWGSKLLREIKEEDSSSSVSLASRLSDIWIWQTSRSKIDLRNSITLRALRLAHLHSSRVHTHTLNFAKKQFLSAHYLTLLSRSWWFINSTYSSSTATTMTTKLNK